MGKLSAQVSKFNSFSGDVRGFMVWFELLVLFVNFTEIIVTKTLLFNKCSCSASPCMLKPVKFVTVLLVNIISVFVMLSLSVYLDFLRSILFSNAKHKALVIRTIIVKLRNLL
jgi:hypothetical protein